MESEFTLGRERGRELLFQMTLRLRWRRLRLESELLNSLRIANALIGITLHQDLRQVIIDHSLVSDISAAYQE